MEIRTEITRKDLNFIDDVALRNVLLERLNELDRAFFVNANCSTIFLAISTIEGIFKHIATIFKAEIKKSNSYPLISEGVHKGKRKDFDRLQIDELYRLLKELRILPEIKGFAEIHSLFRDYRNFIHPQAHLRKEWAIDLGQAQMALGLLNATTGHLAQYIFIGNEKYVRIAGQPDYVAGAIQLNRDRRTRWNSFLVRDQEIKENLALSFDLELPPGSIFNFVFNFVNEDNFRMLRLDNRDPTDPYQANSLLHSTQREFWVTILRASPKRPLRKPILPVQIRIDFTANMFSLIVDGKPYTFDRSQNIIDQIQQGLRIGFFNELGTVKLWNICLSDG